MKRFIAGIAGIDKSLYVIAGGVLACMIILTFFDVILRNFGHPITGSMEIIQYGGAIVFGFSIPYGTMLGAQVLVDIVTEKLSPGKKRTIEIITRCIGIIIFLFIA
jgi:TRAP-type C4-dicarboxylate transport system permease small subunit